jgi:nicotinamidase-related amidase
MAKSALLVMDLQRAIVARTADAGYLPRLRGTIDAARGAGIPVITVVIGFRTGHPEVSARNRTLSAITRSGGFVEGDPNAQIHPDVAPRSGDIVVTKRRVSAFSGSDLDVVLRAGDIDSLVLTGIATSGVVLSTCARPPI